MNLSFFHIENGKIVNPVAVKRAFKGLPDGRYELKITKKNRRSLNQNRYYFGVCVRMVRDGLVDLGHDVTLEETHDFLKSKFHSEELVNESTGEIISIPRSTTEMNKEDFSNYIEKIQRFSAEFLNVVIPNPNSQMALDYSS
jgi:hypothetical protein